MWLIRAYRGDDELAVERSLPHVTVQELEQRLGLAPTTLGSTPLGASELECLGDILSFPVDMGLHWFLDFDADEQPAERRSSRLRASA